MTIGTNFPVSDYYKSQVITGRTLSRAGSWWSAVLVIEDPKNGETFLAAYKWQLIGGVWKARSKWNVRSAKDADQLVGILNELKLQLKTGSKAN